MKISIVVISFFVGLVSYSQYCIDGGPQTEVDSNLEWLMLVGENSSISYTGCTGITGVEQVQDQSIYLSADSSYSASCQFGTCGGNFAGSASIWIDYNNDQLFDSSELIDVWTGTPPTASSQFSFTVPSTITTGISRMRVMQYEGGTLPLDPCASFSWGSVTDFNVYLQNGIDCSSSMGNTSENSIEIVSLPFIDSKNTAICFTDNHSIYNSPDVYYKIPTNLFTNSIDISTCQSDFDTHISVLDSSLTILYSNDDSDNCAPQSFLSIPIPATDSIYIVVEGWGSESGNSTLEITEGTLSMMIKDKETLILSPNPVRIGEHLSIKNYQGNIAIHAINGVLVFKQFIQKNESISTSTLKSGTYFIVLENGDNLKLIVQ